MKNLHLICNAHIDPVWLWDIEEGISAAISTFRMAAAFCEEYEGLIFNHNEVLLYEWIEEQEPLLFARIQRLVREGKWHIMGGWYLQPDCNMPNGESFIRQMETGREYFREKFGVCPTTAINFDPFGHSRGLVQLMVKAGFDSYLFCRPGQGDCPLPDDDFVWVGFDGSKIMAHRASDYGSLMGEAGRKIRGWMETDGQKGALMTGCVLWGVGNHGGGPSRKDLDEIGEMMEADDSPWHLMHSTPEAYFADRVKRCKERGIREPEVKRDLNAWAVGCYTSQIRVKQKHCRLEGELSVTEKMLSQAVLTGKLSYPEESLKEAEKALLFSQFHDILPGTAIRPVEERAIRMLDYGLEIVGKWKRRAFFALLSGERKAEEGEYPVFVYNPHPYEIEADLVCEFQMANQNWTRQTAVPAVTMEEIVLPSQLEKEDCNLNLDWRKRVVFHGHLKASRMNRFSVRFVMCDEKPERKCRCIRQEQGKICFDNGQMYVAVNCSTGLIDAYRVDGRDYLKAGAGALTVAKTDCDPWGMNRHSYSDEIGRFALMEEEEGSRYSGTSNERHAGNGKRIPSVRIIEAGSVRAVVEAVFSYGCSQACVRYILPVQGSAIEMEVQVNWAEKGKFLKLEIPTVMERGIPYSETAYGVMEQSADGEEKVFQRWCGFWERDQALTVINRGNYGGDFSEGIMRISLIHSAAYSAHPIGDRPLLTQDRLLPYIDQGERMFFFRIQGGEGTKRRELVGNEAVLFQEAPMIVQAFPAGSGGQTGSTVLVDDPGVILSAWRKQSRQNAYLIRLFESTGKERRVNIGLPTAGISRELMMGAYEVKTLKYRPMDGMLEESGIFG